MPQPSGLTVAVTGETGELGKPFVRVLEQTPEVARVRAMARRPFDPRRLGWRKTEYRQGDILDRAAVEQLVAEVDVVAHLAFIVVKANADSYEINIEGSRNVFEATAAAGIPRLVYTSSLAAYGYHAHQGLLTEDAPARGTERHAYSRQKADVEHVLREALPARAPMPTCSGRASWRGPTRRRCSIRFRICAWKVRCRMPHSGCCARSESGRCCPITGFRSSSCTTMTSLRRS